MSNKKKMKVAKKVLAPHREQNAYVYVRVKRLEDALYSNAAEAIFYPDNMKTNRTIASRRVEAGVEVIDYLKLCRQHHYSIHFFPDGDVAGVDTHHNYEIGKSVREVYHKLNSKFGAVA